MFTSQKLLPISRANANSCATSCDSAVTVCCPKRNFPPPNYNKSEDAVNRSLARCVLSVHLIGKRYGSTPEDNPRSLVCIQDDMAAQRTAKDPNFSRLLWMPQGLMTPALEITDERQKEFVTALQNRVGERAELLQTSIEDLENTHRRKTQSAVTTGGGKTGRSKLKQVYLICENRDRSFIRPDQRVSLQTEHRSHHLARRRNGPDANGLSPQEPARVRRGPRLLRQRRRTVGAKKSRRP